MRKLFLYVVIVLFVVAAIVVLYLVVQNRASDKIVLGMVPVLIVALITVPLIVFYFSGVEAITRERCYGLTSGTPEAS